MMQQALDSYLLQAGCVQGQHPTRRWHLQGRCHAGLMACHCTCRCTPVGKMPLKQSCLEA